MGSSQVTKEETEETLPEVKARSATIAKKAAKVEDDDDLAIIEKTRSATVSDKRQRLDRHGNPITTVIGAFSVETRKLLLK